MSEQKDIAALTVDRRPIVLTNRDIETLRGGLRGSLVRAGDPTYEESRNPAPWTRDTVRIRVRNGSRRPHARWWFRLPHSAVRLERRQPPGSRNRYGRRPRAPSEH